MGQIASLSERETALVLGHIKAEDALDVQRMDEELRNNHEKLSGLFKAYEATVFGAEEQDRFQRHSELPVRLAREGDSLSSGTVLVAGRADHLVFKDSHKLGYTAEPAGNPYHPSVDVFFGSATRFFRGPMIGVLLTGMGRDGARSLKSLRDGGHHTIAQDQHTSAVYDMPKAAAAIDAASEILPLQNIGPRLRELSGSEVKATHSENRRSLIVDRAPSANTKCK